jgi:hypothetical protein
MACMGQSVKLDDRYYAQQSHGEAPWLIRDEENRVVGHFSAKGGLSWGGAMKKADEERVAELVKEKLR